MEELARHFVMNRTIEYNDNRISHFSAQHGKCAVTGREFLCLSEIHCHHIKPKHLGGNDRYGNLTLVLEEVHRLIHATNPAIIAEYATLLKMDDKQLEKLNVLRAKLGNSPVMTVST